ncbi:MAG: cyclic 2,3-diphosphoglycerate synthase [Candidatus Marsarchaeota archaeon]|nr:cyclic 2,3-diphosphoglycerate synthase [Candidatus Marsarchaeota archaeon]
MSNRKKVIIIGAAGRDFHNFNVLFRDNNDYEVVAFTANQIPYISDRVYPKELSGHLYKNGIKIYDESELKDLIIKNNIDISIMSYSDLPYNEVMKKCSIVNAAGSDFWLVAPEKTMLKSKKPVIAICAVRTGCGKSQTSRYVAKKLRDMGKRVILIRHPMPYGILKEQINERFEKLSDLDRYKTTIEEREDYEPHIKNNFVIYAGVDYDKILRSAEKEADIIIWDGGNNDAPFIKPDLFITVADPLRAGNELTYYPGEIVARMADVIIINKVNSATKKELSILEYDIKTINKTANIIYANSLVIPDKPEMINGKTALVIEDGPTITHGGMKFGAGMIAARNNNAKIISAKKYAVGEIKKTFEKYTKLELELPAMGYSPEQIKDLRTTINNAKCDIVISATPTRLDSIIKINKPFIQVNYELQPKDNKLDKILENFAKKS